MTRSALNVRDLREGARRRLPRMVFDFIDGAADDELTLRANERAYERATFRPRVGVDVGAVTTRIELFGTSLAFPVVLGPTGLPGLAHPLAELAAAQAAHAAGTVFTASTRATVSTGSRTTLPDRAGSSSTPGATARSPARWSTARARPDTARC